MSAYQVTREGQILGSFQASQIQEGLQTGRFLPSDWGWCEGMAEWKGLTEIFGDAPQSSPRSIESLSSSMRSLIRKPVAAKTAESHNPYAPPASGGASRTSSGGGLPQDVIDELRKTRPWVLFIAIMLWICGGIFLLAVLFNMAFMDSGAASNAMTSGSAASMIGYLIGAGLGFFVLAYLILYPTLKLTRYASGIARFASSESFTDLAEALSEQRRFWRFHGIVLVATLAFWILLGLWVVLMR